MGNFKGHILPGSFFIAFGIWWTINIWVNYFRAQDRKKKRPFQCRLIYPVASNCTRLKCCHSGSICWEGIVKVVVTGIGIVGEFSYGYDAKLHYVHAGNAQHITMFAAFGLTGVVDILLFHKVALPSKCDYMSVVLALVVESILFKFHLHGRTMLNTHVHTLLLYTLYMTIPAVLAEMYFDKHVLAAFARTFLFLLQGTWFFQAAFILFSPLPRALPWKQDSPHEVTLVTLFYTWHLGSLFVLMLCIGGIVGCCLRYRRRERRNEDVEMQSLLSTDAANLTPECAEDFLSDGEI
ncbi:transmembrane protein 45B [Lingula anatina]|uniref:Transmembrane protein 45B n=1 Tax=Lingula anatina TaxID=7574 RepID=A0A1S3K992_LINAN|nr:transmembrane protein 45B [Lingula anatina]|eukprot:XP_013419193.1 transmembrane protein 45B [Lingula anatina]